VSATRGELLSPADVAKTLGVSETDVMAVIQSGELPAKKIGTSYRITRAALDAYVSS
jgi:excisionase family DNA binding protein